MRLSALTVSGSRKRSRLDAGREVAGSQLPVTPYRHSRRRPVVACGACLAFLALLASPSAALATPRPSWHPGPPWAPLNGHSAEALLVSNLFWIVTALSAIMFIGITIVLILIITRFSARDDAAEPTQLFGNRKVEIIWTLIPAFVLAIAFIATVVAIHDINSPARGKTILNVNAVGHQWWWEFQYPSYGVTTADEVHVPTGDVIHFHVESADVIHSFWAPQLARQIDANPAQDNPIFVPPLTQTGIFGGACYEYCGDDHAWMKFRMVVQTPGQFKEWVKLQRKPASTPSSALALAGRKVFLRNTCVDCHEIMGTTAPPAQVAPNLTHVGSRWTIGAGAAPMTEADLVQWVKNPNTYKPGALMPGYPLLSSKDLKALAAYLYNLK